MSQKARAASVTSLTMVLIALVTAVPVAATGPTITGAGSTWVQIALDQWRADIARQGYLVNYLGTGSTAGRQFYEFGNVDFAASEIPFQPDELAYLQASGRTFQYLPDVAGGTGLMYNLHAPDGSRITTLRLDADTTAKIFTGGITLWSDSEIAALNPNLVIREKYITPVIRSDGSGTSAQLSQYLASQAPGVWDPFGAAQGCPAPCSFWPAFPGSFSAVGSDSVANFVATDSVGSGAIGYVESGYAFGRGFPVASLHNASGNFSQPTASNVTTALSHATLNVGQTANLAGVYAAPEANAYPLSSYSYLITPTATGFGFDSSKGFVLGTWINYIACAGQREAAPLGYAPLPLNAVQDVFGAVQRIPGSPAPPLLDYQHCPNPALPWVTPDTLRADVQQAFAAGDIQGAGIENSILAKLAAGSYGALINQLQAQSGKAVTPSTASRLTADLQYLIAN